MQKSVEPWYLQLLDVAGVTRILYDTLIWNLPLVWLRNQAQGTGHWWKCLWARFLQVQGHNCPYVPEYREKELHGATMRSCIHELPWNSWCLQMSSIHFDSRFQTIPPKAQGTKISVSVSWGGSGGCSGIRGQMQYSATTSRKWWNQMMYVGCCWKMLEADSKLMFCSWTLQLCIRTFFSHRFSCCFLPTIL
jgi:hypothetical protein